MALPEGVVAAAFHVGSKGRVVLPAALRRAARIEDGAEVVARLVGDGQLLLETKDAVRARVWGAAPDPAGLDVTADVREMREQDIANVARSEARQQTPASEQDSEAAGAALLAHLGL